MSINRSFISGNLAGDAEVRYTKAGKPVADFTVVVDDRRKNPDTGEWEDSPNFIECAAFGKQAEFFGQKLKKGMKVAVEGSLRTNMWEKEGKKRFKLQLVAENVEFMSASTRRNADGIESLI